MCTRANKYHLLCIAMLMLAAILTNCTTSIAPKKAGADNGLKQFSAARDQLQVRKPTVRSEKDPLVLVHYMPWFQAPPVETGYGFHWHQGGGVFDPFETLSDGRAKIASHYYPLTGPYDTRDTSVLEYQVSIMKMSGIDGVIFDWYGIEDALDYKQIHESTIAMIAVLKKAGMKFAVCYEDQSIGKMIEAKGLTKEGALEEGKKVFSWMQNAWFTDDAYVKFDRRPLVLCFGPQYFKDWSQWTALFEKTNPKPWFVSLDNHNEGTVDGSYNWPPMWAATAGKLGIPRLVTYLNDFYTKQYNKAFLVATAFPGFHDIYQQAGNGASYGFLDDGKTETFRLTVDAALMANPDVIQIATWNDYGEGTTVEPTIERGYEYLEYLQGIQKNFDPVFPFDRLDLRSAIEIYKLTVSGKATDDQKKLLGKATDAIFSGNASALREALKGAKITTDFSVSPLLRDTSKASTAASSTAKVFDAAGKKNLALGMPVVASSHIYDFTGNKAIDGDLLTYWEGGTNTYPNTVIVDLVSSRQLSSAVIKLNPKRIWNSRKQKIEVLVSDDGQKYTSLLPAAEYAFDPAANENVVAITLNVKARYLQLVFTNNTGGKAGQIAELEVYGE